MKETDLFLPVKSLFESLGYKISAEIKNLDIIALKENEVIIVELKVNFNLKLILQAIERQNITNKVYIAIPRPKNYNPNLKSFKEKENLLRRLKLGLIFVSLNIKKPYAQIVFEPALDESHYINKERKHSVMKELSSRNSNDNIGGTKGKLITAYRENALLIVHELIKNTSMSVKELRIATGCEKVQTILYNNYYDWFKKVKRGVYELSEKGIKAYDDYKFIIDKLV